MSRSLFFPFTPVLFLSALCVSAQTAPPFGAPKSMKLCAGRCENLTWAKDHYDGIREGEEAVTTTYTIIRWQADGIEMKGKNNKAEQAKMQVFVTLTGKPAQAGGSITDGKATWHILSQVTTIPLQLTWEAPPALPAQPSSPSAAPPATCAAKPVKGGPPAGLPVELYECDVSPTGKDCGVWQWTGKAYEGFWANGAIGRITVQGRDPSALLLKRTDPEGTKAGLTATYTGKWDGKQITEAKFPWVWNGKTAIYEWTASTEFFPGTIAVDVFKDCHMGGGCRFWVTNQYPFPISAYLIAATSVMGSNPYSLFADYRVAQQPLQKKGERRDTGIAGSDMNIPLQMAVVAVLAENGRAFGVQKAIDDIRAKRIEQVGTYTDLSAKISKLAGEGQTTAQINTALEQLSGQYSTVRADHRYVDAGHLRAYSLVMDKLKSGAPVAKTLAEIETLRASLQAESDHGGFATAYLADSPNLPQPTSSGPPVAVQSTAEGTAEHKVGVKVPAAVSEKLLVKRVPPEYPSGAKSARIQGTVKLEFTVAADGSVTDVTSTGPPVISKAAEDAVGQWKFKPYLVNGQPTAMRTTTELQFTLNQ